MTSSADRKVEIRAGGILIRVHLRPRSSSDPTILADYSLPDGTRRRLSTGTQDLDEAETRLKGLPIVADVQRALGSRESRARVTWLDEHDPKLADIFDYYTDVHLPNANRAEKTLAKARQVLRDFETFCRDCHVARVTQLGRNIVDRYAAELRERKKSPKTVHGALSMIRAALYAAVNAEMLHESPIRKWLLPAVPETSIEPLTVAELREVLEIIQRDEPEIAPVVRWIALTGSRPSDAVDLRWSQVDLAAGYVTRTLTKTKRLAKYAISAEASSIVNIEKSRNPTNRETVFTDQYGRPFTVHVVYRRFTRCLQRAAYPRQVNLKDLRHTFASLLANDPDRPCPLPTLQVLMGHTRIETTLKYVRPQEGRDHLDQFALKISSGYGNKKVKKKT